MPSICRSIFVTRLEAHLMLRIGPRFDRRSIAAKSSLVLLLSIMERSLFDVNGGNERKIATVGRERLKMVMMVQNKE